jgi:hypothetical protein
MISKVVTTLHERHQPGEERSHKHSEQDPDRQRMKLLRKEPDRDAAMMPLIVEPTTMPPS